MVQVSSVERPGGAEAGRPTRWCRDERALWREVRDGFLVLAPGTDDPVMLSGVSVLVWDLLAVPASVAELARAIGEAQEVDPDTVAGPLATLLEQLRELGLAAAAPDGADEP